MTLVNPTEHCLASVFKEFGTTKAQVKEDVQLIKTWLGEQPHLPHIQDDIFLENILVRCKCSVQRAKQTVEMHFTLKTALPEFFADRDPMEPNLQNTMDMMKIVPLPQINSDGYRVVMLRNVDKDPTKLSPELSIKFNFMIADIRLMEDSCIGDIYLYDFVNVGLGFFTPSTLPEFKKMVVCATQGYRARIKAIHFINAPPYMEVMLTLIKTLLKNKLVSRIHVHPDLESLYRHVDQDVLPEEYGGKAKSLDKLGCEWKEKTGDYRSWFLEQNDVGKAVESKRPAKSFNNTSDLFGFEGTFKKLCVD